VEESILKTMTECSPVIINRVTSVKLYTTIGSSATRRRSIDSESISCGCTITVCSSLINYHGYYSDANRKYIRYSNPVKWQSANQTTLEELGGLKVALALGQILDRVVILPRFHCYNKTIVYECPLNSLINMVTFNNAFSGRYRESSFLQHPKVPVAILASTSEIQYLDSSVKKSESQQDSVAYSLEFHDIIARFGNLYDYILTFNSLYGTIPTKFYDSLGMAFEEKVAVGFKNSTYRQYA